MTVSDAVADPSAADAGAALFPQVARERRLSDKVADMMLETILSGRFQVGDRLPSERALGEQFGVSRTVVRESGQVHLEQRAHLDGVAEFWREHVGDSAGDIARE